MVLPWHHGTHPGSTRRAPGPQRLSRRGDAHLPELRQAAGRAEVQAVLPGSPVRLLSLLRGLLLEAVNGRTPNPAVLGDAGEAGDPGRDLPEPPPDPRRDGLRRPGVEPAALLVLLASGQPRVALPRPRPGARQEVRGPLSRQAEPHQ